MGEVEELRAEIERLRAERDAAQEHVAYHLRDYALNADPTGDLAVDMAAYAGRLRVRVERVESLMLNYATRASSAPTPLAQWKDIAADLREALGCSR